MEKFQPINKTEKIVISIRIDENKIEIIDKISSEINISRNELISQCLDFAIKNLELEKEKINS